MTSLPLTAGCGAQTLTTPTDYLYPISLAVISAAVTLAERLVPWRPQQRQLRPGLWSDLLFLVFNGHFLA